MACFYTIGEKRYDEEGFKEYLRAMPLHEAAKYIPHLASAPEMPFKTSWESLALKRMVRYAAENSYDALSWDSGDTNADRYDLSKQVDRITVDRVGGKSGTLWVRAYKDGAQVINSSHLAPEQLPDIIGKEAAERAVGQIESGAQQADLSGLDLKVGGEGMRAFYDRILPAAMNKLVKRFGAKVGAAEMPTHHVQKGLMTQDEWDDFRRDPANAEKKKVHIIAITQALRSAAVGEGFPLFQPGAQPSRGLTEEAETRRLLSVEKQRQVKASFAKLTPAAEDKWTEVEGLLRQAIGHFAGPEAARNARFHRSDTFQTPGNGGWGEWDAGGAAGAHWPERGLIELALGGRAGKEAFSTAAHEAYHYVKRHFATDNELAILAREAKRMEGVFRKFRTQYDFRPMTDEEVAAVSLDEIETTAFQAYAKARAANSDGREYGLHVGVRRWFERVLDGLRRLRNGLNGLGFRTTSDIWKDVYEGRMKGRPDIRPARLDIEGHLLDVPEAMAGPRTPRADRDITERIKDLFPSEKRAGFIEATQNYNYRMKLLQNDVEARYRGWTAEEAARLDADASSLPDEKQFSVLKELLPGKITENVNVFRAEHLKPLVDLANRSKISLQDIGDYLKAKGAEDRNSMIADIYPAGHQFNEALRDPAVVGGSGFSANQARATIARIEGGPRGDIAREVWQRAKAIVDFNREMMIHYGLENRETINGWARRSPDYMPYRAWEEAVEGEPDPSGDGRSLGVIGRETKQAFGRTTEAENPLVHLIDQAYRTIDRGERNLVHNALAETLAELKRPVEAGGRGVDISDIATINRGRPKKVIDPTTGMAMTVDDAGDRWRPEAVNFKRNGKPMYLIFQDRKLAEAIKRTSPYSLGKLRYALLAVNKMKSLWTHYSPDFAARHFFGRYLVEGALNAFQLKETGGYSPAKWLADAFPGLGKASRAINERESGEDAGQLGHYWDEMKAQGGHMAFRAMRDIDSVRNELTRDLRDLTGKPHISGLQKLRAATHAIDRVFNTWDNATRLATYAQARDQGMSPQAAALRARNATVNYQKRGNLSNWAGLIMPFFNTAVQTGARMGGAAQRSSVMRKVFTGTVGAGVGLALWNYLAGGNDKDGTPWFEKIPPWERALNIIILNPFERDEKGGPMAYKLPMPYNYALPLTMGYHGTAMVLQGAGLLERSTESALDRTKEVLKSALMAFSPLGEGGNTIDMFTPEVLKPLAHIAENQTWTGAPLHPSGIAQHGPNAESGWPTKGGNERTGQGWKDIASGVNQFFGGSKTKSGPMDFYPEDYREIFDQFFGAQKRFALEAAHTAEPIVKGEAPKPTDIPIARVFRGTDYDLADRVAASKRNYLATHPWLR